MYLTSVWVGSFFCRFLIVSLPLFKKRQKKYQFQIDTVAFKSVFLLDLVASSSWKRQGDKARSRRRYFIAVAVLFPFSDEYRKKMSAEQSKQLIDALSSQPVNILTIRSLCRDNPGLISSAGLRLKAWGVLLLGSEINESDIAVDFSSPMKDCDEQHVLENDIPRTRAEVASLRSETMRESIRLILQKFCVDHEIQYKQGMNEVILHTTYHISSFIIAMSINAL